MSERRIGAFGGTFDPVHNGHLEIARTVVADFELDKLLIIPAHRPPHKVSRVIADAHHRYTMAVLATLDEPRVLVSTIELEAPERPYTFETIERLRDAYGEDASLFFVMGADSFEEINTWRESARVLLGSNMIVITRPGHALSFAHLEERFRSTIIDLRGGDTRSKLRDSNENHIYLTDCVNISVSSTDVRQTAVEGESIAALVPARVADYVKKYKVYG
jgi:nicotinate-nucleotide adenylyltransferase